MELIQAHFYLPCAADILRHIRLTPFGRKNLNLICNQKLCILLYNMILSKNPASLLTVDANKYYYHNHSEHGLILCVNTTHKCKVCNKQAGYYEYTYIKYIDTTYLLVCKSCYDKCINYAKTAIKALVMPQIYQMLFLYNQTPFCETLVQDINHYIFRLFVSIDRDNVDQYRYTSSIDRMRKVNAYFYTLAAKNNGII